MHLPNRNLNLPQVIVITHSRTSTSGNGPSTPRVGIRYLHPSLKVYYLPILPIASDATLPQYLTNLPFLRNILIRERVQILHGHATLSSMALEGLMQAAFFRFPLDLATYNPALDYADPDERGDQARTIRTVFTDHSLFGFGDAVGILTNKLLAGALRNIDAVICVSHAGLVPLPFRKLVLLPLLRTCVVADDPLDSYVRGDGRRENTTLRAQLDPNLVSVLPNAIVPESFLPQPDMADPEWSTLSIVELSCFALRGHNTLKLQVILWYSHYRHHDPTGL